MAKAEKVEVALSNTDRQLLRDIRDALRALGVEPEDEDSAAGAVRRLVESGARSAAPVFSYGNGPAVSAPPPSPPDEWDYRFLDDHFAADSKGYTWNGSGWVPKE